MFKLTAKAFQKLMKGGEMRLLEL